MKKLMKTILMGILVAGLATALAFSQGTVTLQAQEGLTTAELQALNSEGNPKKRANNAIQLADKKAEEVSEAALRGDSAAAENAGKGYETALNHAWNSIHQGEQQGAALTDTIGKVSEVTSKHQSTLADVFERVPEQAKPHIEQAMEVSSKGHARALEALASAAAPHNNPLHGQQRVSRGSGEEGQGAGRAPAGIGAGGFGSVGAGARSVGGPGRVAAPPARSRGRRR